MPLEYSAECRTARSLAFPLIPLPFPSRNGRCDTIVTGAASAVRCIELQALDLTAPQLALAGIVGQDKPSQQSYSVPEDTVPPAPIHQIRYVRRDILMRD